MEKGIDCNGKQWERIERGQAPDISQQRFGMLVVLFRVTGEFTQAKESHWLCLCDCGNYIIKTRRSLRQSPEASCGCKINTKISDRRQAKLEGQRFNRLTVVKKAGVTAAHKTMWECQCDCGNITKVSTSNLVTGHTKSCGCVRKEVTSQRRWADLSGQKFNHLTVLRRNWERGYNSKNVYYICRCDCGREIEAIGESLIYSKKLSCGCMKMSLGEEQIQRVLEENNIRYLYDKNYFKDLILPGGGIGRYDFIIFDEQQNIVRIVEFDGAQHFYQIQHSLANNIQWNFEYTKNNDEVKNKYAKDHNIPLVRIPYTQLNKIDLEMIMGDKFLV